MTPNSPLTERFIRYAKIDTQSAEETGVQPSTAKQFDLARLLAAELGAMGIETDFDEEYCYVYASLPGSEPYLGFVAHMDTSPAASGSGVSPRIIRNYQGNDDILKTEDFPELLNHIGEDLIATDGTTLLGADDKAGVAEIMEMLAFYVAHPEIPHRGIAVAFTPDEEIGAGTDHFNPERFGAKEAYTVDGGKLGELEYECFNAAAAKISVRGRSVHPGDAKNKMINAAALAVEFHGMMPPFEVPEHTEGYEGFYFLEEISGDCENALLKYIVRDHDREKFMNRKAYLENVTAYLNGKYGDGVFELKIRDQYRNMAECLKDRMELVERAKAAFEAEGVSPAVQPIRGGTDGSALTFMGIPCPNLSTGGYNFHGRFEYASINEMETMVRVLIRLAGISG